MTDFEIREKFKLVRNNGKTLTEQLQQQLANFINKCPAGIKLPPECRIAEELNISRVTVRRALNHFLKQGKITRKGSRGTFIAGQSKRNLSMHPILNGINSNPVTNLNFLNFEILSQQKVFWNKAVDMFNVGDQQSSITINELPQNISMSNYSDYVTENGFDILMLGSDCGELNSLLAPLPESIATKLGSNEYICGNTDFKALNAVPFKSSVGLICWNKDLADKLGIKNIPQRLQRGQMLELHGEAAEKMLKGYGTGGYVWTYFALKGLSKFNLDFFERRFKQFERFSGIPNIFICEQEYGLEAVDKFNRGKLLFAPGFSTFYCNPNPSFNMGMGVFMPDKGNILERGALYLGVYKNSPNKKAAFRFIDLMLSEPLQNMIVTMLWDSTCLKKSAKLFSKLFEDTNDQYITEYLKRSPIVSDVQNHDYMQKQHFMIHDLRDILYALMNGKLKSEQAAKIAVKRWKKLKNT